MSKVYKDTFKATNPRLTTFSTIRRNLKRLQALLNQDSCQNLCLLYFKPPYLVAGYTPLSYLN